MPICGDSASQSVSMFSPLVIGCCVLRRGLKCNPCDGGGCIDSFDTAPPSIIFSDNKQHQKAVVSNITIRHSLCFCAVTMISLMPHDHMLEPALWRFFK